MAMHENERQERKMMREGKREPESRTEQEMKKICDEALEDCEEPDMGEEYAP